MKDQENWYEQWQKAYEQEREENRRRNWSSWKYALEQYMLVSLEMHWSRPKPVIEYVPGYSEEAKRARLTPEVVKTIDNIDPDYLPLLWREVKQNPQIQRLLSPPTERR